jgi:hypothetical protein
MISGAVGRCVELAEQKQFFGLDEISSSEAIEVNTARLTFFQMTGEVERTQLFFKPRLDIALSNE